MAGCGNNSLLEHKRAVRNRGNVELSRSRYEPIIARTQQPKTRGDLPPSVAAQSKVALRAWKDFCDLMGVAEEPYQHIPKCDGPFLTAFMKFVIDRSGGELKVRRSLKFYWNAISRCRMHLTGEPVDRSLIKHVENSIDELTDEHDLQRAPKDKDTLSFAGLKHVLDHHWSYDKTIYHIERQRVQVSAFLILAAITGTRPGAVLESNTRPGSDIGLHYGDIEFLLRRARVRRKAHPPEDFEKLQLDDDPVLLCLKVTYKYRKGDKYSAKPVTMTCTLDDDVSVCPVVHFLALAFADEAFEDLRSPEDIQHLRVKPGMTALKLELRKDFNRLPIFRGVEFKNNSYQVHPTRIMTYSSMHNVLHNLSHGVGFERNLTAYCIRRYTGNVLDVQATEADRNNIMGHASGRIFEKSYWNRIVNFNMQGAVTGTQGLDRDFMSELSSLMTSVDPTAPTALSPHDMDVIRQVPEVVAARKFRAAVVEELQAEFGSVQEAKRLDKASEYWKADYAVKNAVRRNVSQAIQRARQAHFATNHRTIVQDHLQGRINNDVCAKEDKKMPELRMPLQRRQVIAAFQPGALGPYRRWEHLRARLEVASAMTRLCHVRDKRPRRHLGQDETLENQAHCVMDDDMDEKAITEERRKLAELLEGRLGLACIYCAADDDRDIFARTKQYGRPSSLRHHVEVTHFARMPETGITYCPLPRCKAETLVDRGHLLNHLHKAHQYKVFPRYRRTKRLVHTATVPKLEESDEPQIAETVQFDLTADG